MQEGKGIAGLEGAEEGLFIMIPFKVLALNVNFNFKNDLSVFGPETGSTPIGFSSRGRGCCILKIHLLNHNQSLKSQRQQLNETISSSTRAIRDLTLVTSLSSDDTSSSLQSYVLAIRPLFLPEDELGAEALELRRASLALTLFYLASKSLVCLG
nr:hypothetical protein [Tanacetum cinerariifolium]